VQYLIIIICSNPPDPKITTAMYKDFHQTEWDAQVEEECRRLVRLAVAEDLDRGHDWTTLCLTAMETEGRAKVVARQAGAVAGIPTIRTVLDEFDQRLQFTAALCDGV
jgi:nicotinate-nucleotide pyrophosphorylase (carboxylating)